MDLGTWGEEVASRHLGRQGYEILERNVRFRTGELDIVARKGDTLCFVEVKTRKSVDSGLPAEAVTPEKQRHLRSAVSFYLHTRRLSGIRYLRMDVIEILKLRGKTYLRHIENAF